MSRNTFQHNDNTKKSDIDIKPINNTTNKVSTEAATNNFNLEYSFPPVSMDNSIQNKGNNGSNHDIYQSATLNEINKYQIVKDTLNTLNNLPLFKNTCNQIIIISGKIFKSNRFSQVLLQKIMILLTKLDNLLAVLIFKKGIDNFINVLNNEKNGKFGIWILWFFIDYLANCSNHILKELIIKPLNLPYNNNTYTTTTTAHNTASNNTSDGNNKLPHLTELTATTLTLSKDIQNKVQCGIVEPTKDNVKKHFDLYIKPTVDQAKETYKTVSDRYETKLKENDESIPKALYSTGLDIGNETIEKLNKFTHKNNAEISTTKN